ncbi:unnamed protein product [Thlaspi arvense]|uniref:Uncharacterized protein n=1 Tax=Thlaspi arvense TaxID=13288 RepID=A0AAU9SD93_THLAR|nr:unnamed protein product [Thlaspi arvense]
MTKSIALYIFIVILVLGMVTKETQGELCRENMITKDEDCESMACAADCSSKWKGIGECVSTTSTTCICTYNC